MEEKTKIKDFKDLIVWQKSMNLCIITYLAVKKLPKEETFNLSSQIKRSVTSIPSNIAEGSQRNSKKEFCHFLRVSLGSSAELETQILLCEKINYLSVNETYEIIEKIVEVRKMLISLILKLK